MGRYQDWRSGTVHPDEGADPLERSHVEAALLALNSPDEPWRVRAAFTEEKADVVAEWNVTDPGIGNGRGRRQVERTVKFRMRLDGASHEARVCVDIEEATWAGEPAKRVVARKRGSGPRTRAKSWRADLKKGPDGKRHRVYDFYFDSDDLRDPLRKVVLSSGWTWRGTRNP